MKYKEFVDWCYDRACDGCWSYNTAVYCLEVVDRINSLPFWKRKKEWLKVKDSIERNIVSVINARIQTFMRGNEDGKLG